MTFYQIYRVLPIFFQNLICSLYGYKEARTRFNDEFYSKLEEYKLSDKIEKERISRNKKQSLITVLLYAKKHTKLYPELEKFSDHDIGLKPFDVLNSMGVLTKQDLRDYDVSKIDLTNTVKIVTSGTTGKALSIFKDKLSVSSQWAIWFRHRSRFGVKPQDISVNFTGKPVVPIEQTAPPYWRYNRAQSQYLVSMQHINAKNIGSIVDFLNSLKPVFYSGYPSILAEVSRLAIDSKLDLDLAAKPRIVFTGAEKLHDYQKKSIENWTGAIITDQYGLTEGNCNFSRCEFGRYHEDFEFSHIEVLNGIEQPDGSIKGKLIGTSFSNFCLPLIRYDTGDIATIAPEGFQCECGRHSRVIIDVDGRVDDFIQTPDGKRVMRLDYIFKNTFEVLEAQIIQSELNNVLVVAVLSENGSKNAFEEKVCNNFKEYISNEMGIDFQYVASIERSGSGKFKAVINRLGK